MVWIIRDGLAGWQPIATADTTANHPLCTIVKAQDPTYGEGEFIYLKGVASTAAGDWVGYTPGSATTPGTSVRAVANGTYPLAVAMSACNTTTKFGWYQIAGTAVALGLTSITHTSGFLALTGTAGALDDASVIGDHVFNARKTTTVHAVGTFLDTYAIQRPFTTNIVTVRN
jgi:hypothetical protein